ncbi:hypothetical protein O0I10_007591 [Lichtheimia ornata]|uniref:Major facilitator superfamily (MFS) profile domain-containing protein n=1 Tax=Lichtheimia ornata TaxID=688661 RepID=A0AAD7V120_9FUNG|nr:uncharacterized protein O0I10_007591 [Lichtheimia ornata]KAJ8656744.1 hypothetical protein O0I10_007591 [Lichtheimia ornata]
MLRDNEKTGGGDDDNVVITHDALNTTSTPTKKREDSSTTHDTSSNTESTTVDDNMTAIRQRLKRKLDIRLAIWAFLGFFALFLDKSNLPNAYVSGMREDLDLESVAYNWADTIMSISLNVSQIPVGLILPRIYPRWFFPTLPVVWGIIQCCMAFVKNHQGLLALRFCLGVAQSAIQPGMAYLLGTWYTENEVAKRITSFRSALGVSSAVGGLIAGGIVQTMANRAGLRAWQWIFVIEGLIAVVIGLAGYVMVPNYPHQTTSWITDHERKATLDIQTSRDATISTSSSPYKWINIKNLVISPYPWLIGCIMMFSVILRQMTMMFVIILNDLGYDSAFANYMSTPMHIFGAIIGIAIGWSADWFGDRVIHLLVIGIWATIWSVVLVAVRRGDTPVPLVFASSYALDPLPVVQSLGLVWVLVIYKSNPNLRALTVGLVSCIAMLIPSFLNVKLWLVTDSPVFWLGKIANVGFGCAMILIILVVWFLLRIQFRLPQPASNSMTSEETQINTKAGVA